MSHSSTLIKAMTSAAVMSLLATLSSVSIPSQRAHAFSTSPSPSEICRKYKKGTRKWKQCIRRNSSNSTLDDIYYAGYWLGESGDYEGAIAVLKQAEDTNDPRLLTYIGYSARKLGNVEGGIAYYMRALSIDPNYSKAREYLGEGYLQKGDLASAKDQLNEIAARCGKSCAEYVELSGQIRKFEDLWKL